MKVKRRVAEQARLRSQFSRDNHRTLYQAGVVPVIPTLGNGIQAESGQEGEGYGLALDRRGVSFYSECMSHPGRAAFRGPQL